MNRKRNHLCASFALALAILGLSVSAQAQKAPRRIIFARGATIARASGYLRGVRDEAWFVIRAGAGQHMRVDVRGRGPTRGVLYFPSGKQDGGPGGVIYDGEIDESGDYRIRVTESSMANAWRGSFIVTVEILPRGQPTPGASALESYVGKYPSEMFRKVPSLKTRLRSLLGTNYRGFFDRLQVEMPITRDGNALVARGCKAHQCTIEEAILVVDLLDGQPYVAIKFDSRIRTFPLGNSRIPEALRNAMDSWRQSYETDRDSLGPSDNNGGKIHLTLSSSLKSVSAQQGRSRGQDRFS